LSILFNQGASMLRIYNESMSASIQYFYYANTKTNLVDCMQRITVSLSASNNTRMSPERDVKHQV